MSLRLNGRQSSISGQSRGWAWTLNNYTDAQVSYLKEKAKTEECWIIFGFEVAPGTGTPHLQGALWFKSKVRFSTVKLFFGELMPHLEKATGSQEQNRVYCSKSGDFYCSGEAAEPGRRTDLHEVQEAIKKGASLPEVAESFFSTFLRYERGLARYIGFRSARRSEPTLGFWMYGETGTGKTRLAFEHSQKSYGDVYWAVDQTMKWIDGYQGERAVIIDDISPSNKPDLSLLLRMIDRYPMKMAVKGGFVEWTPRAVYITSNFEPRHIFYDKPQVSIDALMRRLDCVMKL